MNIPAGSAFDLPERLSAKRRSALIGADETHIAAIGASLARSEEELALRLDRERRSPGGSGQRALDRDQEVRRLTTRLRTLRRHGLDLCLGRMDFADGSEPVYIGRLGLSDDDGRRLLLDWRSPAAEPFFAATLAVPMGLLARRRYRWSGGHVIDYWDEALTPDGVATSAALDAESAFIAELGASRSPRMQGVLATIQADQDAVIRAGSRGTLVVDGGPGTGKTVVALHRAAYLLYADPRVAKHRGGVLFVGPSTRFLDYVSDVLPDLGEEGVHPTTLRGLLPEGETAQPERDPMVADLKASGELLDAIDRAVAVYEVPPTASRLVETEWLDIVVEHEDWAEAFAAAEDGTPHNEAREQVWTALVGVLVDKYLGELPPGPLTSAVHQDQALRSRFDRAWPLLDPDGVVADLWTVPAYLSAAAPGLTAAGVAALQRADGRAWTIEDLPILDAARRRIGDPGAPRRRRERAAAIAAEQERMSMVIDELIAGDDGEGLVTMLRVEDARESLIDEAALPSSEPELLSGPFAHIVVDEAQELTDAQWRMLRSRCPSRSFTIVGDRAQARRGFAESWQQRLRRVGLDRVAIASLTVNYRTPEEVMSVASSVIRAALPDANVPTSVRRSGRPVRYGVVSELEGIIADWLSGNSAGTGCVIGASGFRSTSPRIRSMTAEQSKGLEFDLVVLVEPATPGSGIEVAVDRYVAMTRATQQLVVLTASG